MCVKTYSTLSQWCSYPSWADWTLPVPEGEVLHCSRPCHASDPVLSHFCSLTWQQISKQSRRWRLQDIHVFLKCWFLDQQCNFTFWLVLWVSVVCPYSFSISPVMIKKKETVLECLFIFTQCQCSSNSLAPLPHLKRLVHLRSTSADSHMYSHLKTTQIKIKQFIEVKVNPEVYPTGDGQETFYAQDLLDPFVPLSGVLWNKSQRKLQRDSMKGL